MGGRFKRSLLLVLLALAGSSGTAVASAPTPGCTPDNFTLQCGLATQVRPSIVHANADANASNGFSAIQGADFAWGGPRSCSAMASIGARFGWSYFSYDTSGKNWDRSLVDEFHRCGIATAGGWETTATRATDGYGAGASDAREAARQAAAVGNVDRPLTFAIDFDASGPDVASYFQGCHDVLGDRCNAYGGYRPLLYLFQHHLVGRWNFQTYAWSGGSWLPASIAPLEQWLNGNTFDHDRAIAADYGQWPYNTGPSATEIAQWGRLRNAAFWDYHRRGCRHVQDADQHCRKDGLTVVLYQEKLWAAKSPPRFALFGPRSTPAGRRSLVGWIVRPEVAYWSSARDASERALARCLSAGPVTFPTPCRQRAALAQRVGYFKRKALETVAANS